MHGKVLVTYASQGGAAAGVAEAIGKVLSANNTPVEVLPIRDVRDLASYHAVVIGSAVHSGQWMPEAMAFVERNESKLRQMPTAIFQVCMMLAAKNESYRNMVPGWLAPLRSRLRPVAEASFAGALWPDRYSKLSEKLGLRIFLGTIQLKPGDYRDWDAIRAWAERIRPSICG